VTAKSDGDVNVLISTASGGATDYSVTASVAYDTTDFTAPSFTAVVRQNSIRARKCVLEQIWTNSQRILN
jgi:hypothetical protein